MKQTLSVVLATYNEAEHIARCLEAIKALADEIIVVDGTSTDSTAKIAKTLGARVITTTNKPNFHINKQMAIDAAKGDWILQLDADEVVDSQLRQSISDVLDRNVAKYDPTKDSQHQASIPNAYWIKRKNFFLDRFLTKGGQYPDPVIRFFRRGTARLPQKDVHEQMKVDGLTGWLDGHLEHYNAPTFTRYITNANRYTSLTAQKLYQQAVPLSLKNDLLYLVVKPKLTFIQLYFRHKGFKDGFPGFVFALFSGLHHALAYMKLGDLYRQNLDN